MIEMKFQIQRFAEIANSTSYILVSGTTAGDLITNSAADVTIDAGLGDDTVSLDSSQVLYQYSVEDGDDLVYGATTDTTINIVGSPFTQQVSGANVILTVGDGKISLIDAADSVPKISGTLSSGGNAITNVFSGAIINGTADAESINNSGAQATIYASGGDDYVYNSASGAKIYLMDGNDTVTSQESATIFGGAGADSISCAANYSFVLAGADNDTIAIQGLANFVDAGDGDDYVVVRGNVYATGSSAPVNNPANTITGGAGDDTIDNSWPQNSSATGGYFFKPRNIYKYSRGDGNDVIVGFDANDTLQITSSTFSTQLSGEDTFVNVGSQRITLKNVSGENLNIVLDTATNSEADYSYEGGNLELANYESNEKINIATDYTGFGFDEENFMLNSSTGTLTVKNARGKLINFAVNNETVAYVFMASSGGTLDGKDYSQLEVILGANNSANEISAGSGGSTLWGGAGSNDILTGGDGADTFFFGAADGSDFIQNASSADTINLYDISLSEIVSANVTGKLISVGFNTNSQLTVQGLEDLSATFKLSDGSAWRYNHSSEGWQAAN